MKVYDIFEGTGRLTRDAVRRAVWSSYADDPFYSVSGDPNDLDDDDFDDF